MQQTILIGPSTEGLLRRLQHNLGVPSHFGTNVAAAHGIRYQATEAAGLLSLTSRLTGRWIHASAMRCKARYKLRERSK